MDSGCRAAEWLAATPVRRVAAVFARSAYLEGGICLAGPGVPRGPLVAYLAELPKLRIGDAIRLDPGPVWRPAPLVCDDPAGLRRVLAAVLAGFRAGCSTRGRAAAGCVGVSWSSAWPTVQAAVDFSARVGGLPTSAQSLVGLGPGLTPAGDDALAGYALVRRALGRSVPQVDAGASGWISRALLQCALDGLAGEDEAQLIAWPSAAAARRVAAHGGTSGLATLLGMAQAVEEVSGHMGP